MIKNIDKTHPIFSSVRYQQDIVPFHLIEVIKELPLLLVSNENSFIIGMSDPAMPVWIWTAEHISNEELIDLCNYFFKKFYGEDYIHFVAKPEIVTILSRRFLNQKHAVMRCINMESFECPKIVPLKSTTVTIERPSCSDFNQLAECLNHFSVDCFGKKLRNSDSNKAVEDFIQRPKSFVIKQGGNVAAIACAAKNEAGNHVVINHVYTRLEYRRRGFASALVTHISKSIMESGKTPMLYTDLSNPTSNKAYKKIGFVERGRVDEIILLFQKNL